MHCLESSGTTPGWLSMILSLLPSPVLKRVLMSILLPAVLAACAQLSISPRPVQPLDPAVAARAIEAEPVPPNRIMVQDFEVSPSSVKDNASPLHRLIKLFRQGSPDEQRVEIGHGVVAGISEQTLKRVNKSGLQASQIPSDKNVSPQDDVLLVTGRVSNADEGNRLTRVALGCGAGESSLDTEVHVFRVTYGERAEVLAFTTHADSGKMPGLLPSLGVGQLFVGPITLLSKIKDTASTGEKIYSSQIDHLAGRTGDEVARYLSQYAAHEGWISPDRAQSVRLAAN